MSWRTTYKYFKTFVRPPLEILDFKGQSKVTPEILVFIILLAIKVCFYFHLVDEVSGKYDI